MKTTGDTKLTRKSGLFGRIRSWFFTGILVTAPVLLTVYITWAAIQLIDGQCQPAAGSEGLEHAADTGCRACHWCHPHVDWALAAGFLGRWIIRLGESLLNRMPVVRTIYGASKQILETIISSQSDAFREVVLVEYPRKELWVIGFVTGGTKGEVRRLVDRDMVTVFVPTLFNLGFSAVLSAFRGHFHADECRGSGKAGCLWRDCYAA